MANQTQIQQPVKAPGQYATVNGLNMYYEIHGKGRPLVLVHGGGSDIYITFGTILPLLAKKHQVIAVELQAHGHTADRNQPLSFEQDADDVAALLQQLHIEKASFFGFSNGGNTVMQIGIRHPQLADKLVIAAAFYKREGMYPWFWEGFKGATLDSMPQPLKDVYLHITGNPAGLQAMFDKDVQRMVSFKDWKEEDIRAIQAPSLVIAGHADVMTPEHTVALYRLLPKAKLAILPGVHGEYIGEVLTKRPGSKVPELAAAMIEEFLQEGE